MKTKEEWLIELKEGIIHNCYDGHYITLIQQIQLDAWKQGMSDASNIATSECDNEYGKICNQIKDCIIKVRNNKTTL